MIFKFFELLFSKTSLKQKKAMWKVKNRYRYEMSKLAREMHGSQLFRPLSDGKKREYKERAIELLEAHDKLLKVIREEPERIDAHGEFKKL